MQRRRCFPGRTAGRRLIQFTGAKTKLTLGIAGTAALTLPVARAEGLRALFSADYLPHSFCYLAKPWLVWTNVATDGLIGASYGLIFGCLIWIATRWWSAQGLRSYLWIFISFGTFIVACGGTHLMDVVTIWLPVYPLSATVKVVCAAVSVPTAICFATMTPELARTLGRYLKAVSTAEQQRDVALLTLGESEKLIAECKLATSELSAAYGRLNTVLECTSDGVITIGPDWTILYGNRKTLGSLPEVQVGESYWRCFPTLVGTETEGYLRTVMEERTETKFETFYAVHQRWFEARCFPTDEGISIFFSDITEEKKMQEQLDREALMREKRIEALSHMAGGLAHEISNPLAIIHGRASDLQRAAAGEGMMSIVEVREASESIVRTSDRAMTILRGLRGFGREAGNDPMEPSSLYEIVEECLDLQRGRLERHHVEVRLELEEGLPMVVCRETQIGQIMTNLLNNAFDAIVQSKAEERWISIGAWRRGTQIFVDVIDTGPGIEDHFKAHLMEPFFTTKEFGLGTGIGLSLSRAIAQDHGGTLTLCDGTEHTCFELVLPIEPAVVVGREAA